MNSQCTTCHFRRMCRRREDEEIEREMISKISFYAAALGTAQCAEDAEPTFEDRAAASNEVAEDVRKDHSETCSSEADSSSESEGEFTIKTNTHLSSAMTFVLNSREAAAVAEVEIPGARGEGGGGRGGKGWLAGGSGGRGAGGARAW